MICGKFGLIFKILEVSVFSVLSGFLVFFLQFFNFSLDREVFLRLEEKVVDLIIHYHALYCPDGKIPDFVKISEANVDQYQEAVRAYSEFRAEIDWSKLNHSIKLLNENDI